MNGDEEFVFINPSASKDLLIRFCEDNQVDLNQNFWEFPLYPSNNDEFIEFDSFSEILTHVFDTEDSEYVFYSRGLVKSWIGICSDKSIVFSINLKLNNNRELYDFAQKYGGEIGLITISEIPIIFGYDWFKNRVSDDSKKYGNFTLINPI